jgi:hypothetical protein
MDIIKVILQNFLIVILHIEIIKLVIKVIQVHQEVAVAVFLKVTPQLLQKVIAVHQEAQLQVLQEVTVVHREAQVLFIVLLIDKNYEKVYKFFNFICSVHN